MSVGLELAGMTTVGFCEIDHACQRVLAKHWPDVPIYPDVRRLTGQQLEADGITDIAVLAAGYPCQGYSTSGERQGSNHDGDVRHEVVRLVEEVRPDWFIGENVVGHISLGLDEMLADLESLSYDTTALVLPACATDARHRRDRLFILAHSNGARGEAGIPEPEPGQERHTDFINNSRDRLARWSGRGEWAAEPDVGRVADGIPNRVDRIKQLGNAVTPQVVAMIGRVMWLISDSGTTGCNRVA